MSVKIRTICTWTERPYEALLYFEIKNKIYLCRISGKLIKLIAIEIPLLDILIFYYNIVNQL